MLLGAGQIHPAAGGPAAAASAAAFNRALAAEMEHGGAARHLAAGVAGTGVPVGFVDMLAVRSVLREEAPEAAARSGFALMTRAGATVQKDGKPLTDPAQAQAELARRIGRFRETALPVLRHIGAL
jgi:hypothetical protein